MRGLSLGLCLVWSTVALADPPAVDVAGIWEGSLTVGAIKMRLAFKVEKKADGTLGAKMDSPDQGAKDIPMESCKVEDGQLKIAAPKLMAEYAGKLSADGKTATGEWKQGGQAFPLEIKRVDKDGAPWRESRISPAGNRSADSAADGRHRSPAS